MSIKIQGCTQCWAAYTIEQWQTLELIRIEPRDKAETRSCSKCRSELTADVEHLGTLDLRSAHERVDDARAKVFAMTRERRWQTGRPVLLALGIAIVVMVAMLLWGR